MVCELQYINRTIRKSNTDTQKEIMETEKGREPSFVHTFHAHTINDHAEDPECAYMRQQIIMNTVHLSLFPST